jgi:hypothetical protein
MRYEDHGKGSTYLVCSTGQRGLGCDSTGWHYKEFEPSFIALVNEIDFAGIVQSEGERGKRLEVENELVGLRGEHAAIVEKQNVMLDLLDKSKIDAVVKRLEALQQQADALTAKIDAKETELANMNRTVVAFHEGRDHINTLLERLQNYKTRAEVASHLKSLVTAIYVAPAGFKGKKLAVDFWVDEKNPRLRQMLKQKARFFIVVLKTGTVVLVTPRSDELHRSKADNYLHGYRILGNMDEMKMKRANHGTI